MKLVLIIFSLSLANWSYAGWDSHITPEKTTVSYYDDPAKGVLKFSEQLKRLKDEGNLDQLEFIRPGTLTEDPTFQKELKTALHDLVPEAWKAAENSSGNSDNPKMIPLRKHLPAAFMKTTLAKELSRDLESFGLRISAFGQEKLRYVQNGDQRRIEGIFHIAINPGTAP